MVGVHITTLGGPPGKHLALNLFADLAATDAVGEHHLEPDPDLADIIAFVDFVHFLDDPKLSKLRDNELIRRFPHKIAVIDWRDRPTFTFPGVYVSGNARQAKWRPMVGGPYPSGVQVSATNSGLAEPPRYLYSFTGSLTHPVRKAIAELNDGRSSIAIIDHATATGTKSYSDDYITSLSDSKFVLCPRGHGASTFRLFETLGAGRVPVIVSDAWISPSRIDWGLCSIRVPENAVDDIPRILRDFEPRWETLCESARKAYGDMCEKSRLWHYYVQALLEARGLATRLQPPKALQLSHAKIALYAIKRKLITR